MIGNMESDFRVVKVKNCEAVPKSKKNVTWSAIQIPLHIVYMDFFHCASPLFLLI